jgi:N-acetyltransferase 10
MVRKKIDNRLRVMIENGVVLGHRTMFVVVGDKGRDQVIWKVLYVFTNEEMTEYIFNILWLSKWP